MKMKQRYSRIYLFKLKKDQNVFIVVSSLITDDNVFSGFSSVKIWQLIFHVVIFEKRSQRIFCNVIFQNRWERIYWGVIGRTMITHFPCCHLWKRSQRNKYQVIFSIKLSKDEKKVRCHRSEMKTSFLMCHL